MLSLMLLTPHYAKQRTALAVAELGCTSCLLIPRAAMQVSVNAGRRAFNHQDGDE